MKIFKYAKSKSFSTIQRKTRLKDCPSLYIEKTTSVKISLIKEKRLHIQ